MNLTFFKTTNGFYLTLKSEHGDPEESTEQIRQLRQAVARRTTGPEITSDPSVRIFVTHRWPAKDNDQSVPDCTP